VYLLANIKTEFNDEVEVFSHDQHSSASISDTGDEEVRGSKTNKKSGGGTVSFQGRCKICEVQAVLNRDDSEGKQLFFYMFNFSIMAVNRISVISIFRVSPLVCCHFQLTFIAFKCIEQNIFYKFPQKCFAKCKQRDIHNAMLVLLRSLIKFCLIHCRSDDACSTRNG